MWAYCVTSSIVFLWGRQSMAFIVLLGSEVIKNIELKWQLAVKCDIRVERKHTVIWEIIGILPHH